MRKTEREELLLWAEEVRTHYMSLEGASIRSLDEAIFFLLWHYAMCEGLHRFNRL